MKIILLRIIPYFQFNKGLTLGLKLSETFCKPLLGLYLMQQVIILITAKCAKMFVVLVMTPPPVPIVLTSASIQYTFGSSFTYLKSQP